METHRGFYPASLGNILAATGPRHFAPHMAGHQLLQVHVDRPDIRSSDMPCNVHFEGTRELPAVSAVPDMPFQSWLASKLATRCREPPWQAEYCLLERPEYDGFRDECIHQSSLSPDTHMYSSSDYTSIEFAGESKEETKICPSPVGKDNQETPPSDLDSLCL